MARHLQFAASVAALLTSIATPAAAQSDFYKGKSVTIVVGFTPGGGYDLYARALSRHLGKHIPGNPTVIVQNAPGAGSLSAVRNLDATLPRDGTAMVTFNSGLVTQSIVQPEAVKIDFRNMAWVGVVTSDVRVCYSFGPKGVKTFDEMMSSKEFILGATGRGSGNYVNGATLKTVFNAPIRQILGYPGSAELRIAIERGELDGDCGTFSSIPLAWLNEKKINPFVRFSEKAGPGVPESAVFINTFAKTDEQRAILDVVNGSDEIGRAFIMSRQVPAERLATMRQAFEATMKDKDFLADMEKLKYPVQPTSGEEAEKLVARLANVPDDIRKKARAIFE